MRRLIGGVEGGGTKYVCAVGDPSGGIEAEIRFPTTDPDGTLSQAVSFFKQFDIGAIGIGNFGPLNLDVSSPGYGTILSTPKVGWSGVDVVRPFKNEFNIPIVLDLDVNTAAYGEKMLVPENSDLTDLVYFTIGTGIGAGVFSNGKLLHGLMHPEAGHMRLPHDWGRDPFPGSCPFHGDCFEGLASGYSLARRWGRNAEDLPEGHNAWQLEADYIAAAMVNTITLLSPQLIIVGGGVMQKENLIETIRVQTSSLLSGYIQSPKLTESMDRFIIPPALGNRSGVLGAMVLAEALLVDG